MASKADYREFVEEFGGDEYYQLLFPSGTNFASSDGHHHKHPYPHIFVAYDPMPDWMHSTKPRQDISDRNGHRYQRGHGDSQQNAEYAAHFRGMRFSYLRTADQYANEVKDQLKQIVKTATGRALFQEIEDTGVAKDVSVKIVPYHGKDRNSDTVWAHLTDGIAATAKGRLVNPTNPKDPRLGSGNGVNALIENTPGVFKERPPLGESSDEVLFHEMVHASRMMRGKIDMVPVDAGYDQEEDYLAIVLTNIYMSDKGLTSFRANHDEDASANDDSYRRIQGGTFNKANYVVEGKDVNKFLGNVQNVNMPPTTLLENFRLSQPAFYNALANLPVDRPKTNWVREYEWQRRATSNVLKKQGIVGAPLQ